MTWNPSKKGAHVTLSVGNTVADVNGDQDCVLSLTGINCATTIGKRCFEITLGANANGPIFGVAQSGQDVNETLGFGAYGWSWCAMNSPTAKFHSGNQGAYGTSLALIGAVVYVMVTVNFGAGTISFRYGTAAGAPTADYGVAFSGLSGTIYPAFGVGYTGTDHDYGTINQDGPFVLTTETGATAWGSTVVADGTRQVELLAPLAINASSILRLGSNHHALVSPDTRRLITTTVGATLSTSASAAQTDEPWALVNLSSKLWTVTADGYLRRFTVADPPVAVDSLNIYAATNRWLTSAGNFVIAPGRSGIVAINTSLAIVDQVDGLSGITLAIGQSGYVYCFNGRGLGHTVAVNTSTGAMSYWGTFAATDCQGMLNGYITGSSLVVGAVASSSVVVFDLTDPQNPTVSTRTTNASDTMRAVLDNTSKTALTDSQPSAFSDLSRWMIPSCGTAAGALTAIAFGRTARISFSALVIPEA